MMAAKNPLSLTDRPHQLFADAPPPNQPPAPAPSVAAPPPPPPSMLQQQQPLPGQQPPQSTAPPGSSGKMLAYNMLVIKLHLFIGLDKQTNLSVKV